MRGYPFQNYPAFRRAAKQLRDRGHEVCSPQEITENSLGLRPEDEGFDEKFDLRLAMADNLDWLCSAAELIVLLPGWSNSLGTKAELAVAQVLGIPAVSLGDFLEDDLDVRP